MVLTAMLIGLAGGLHCAGMCSPLAVAVSNLSPKVVLNRFLYNFGRILTYGMLGALVGAFGALAELTSFQPVVSVVMGIVLVLLGVSGVTVIRIPMLTPMLQKLATVLKSAFGNLLSLKHAGALFLMGGINGLLPCGLTYFALTYCLTLPGAFQGFAFMILFGLGTVPVMVGVPALVAGLAARFRMDFRHATSLIMILLGTFLVVRSFWIHPEHPNPSVVQASEVVCP